MSLKRWPPRLKACAFALLLAHAVGSCSPPRAIEAARVLADMAAGEGASELKWSTPAPQRVPVQYWVAERRRAGDLYFPGDGAKAALVLVPGVTPQGKDDPRLVAFAMSLARARFIVLVPDIANLRDLKVGPADADAIADAVDYLAGGVGGEGGYPSAPRTGMPLGLAAISYAVGPALLAALEKDAGGRLCFIVAIGGYYDSESVVRFFTTGYFREAPEGKWRHSSPNAYGKWVFLRNNADRLTDPRDRALLAAMARRKMKSLEAGIGDLVAKLGPEGRSVHALIVNRDPQRVASLIAALPGAIRADMAALNLKNQDFSGLAARLILVHGRDDAIIPYSESKALAAAAPDCRANLYLVESLAHVDIAGLSGIIDSLTLWRAVYRLIGERDAPPCAR